MNINKIMVNNVLAEPLIGELENSGQLGHKILMPADLRKLAEVCS